MPASTPSSTKSTNDRLYEYRGLRAGFRLLNHVPSLAAPIAETLFFTPPRHRPSSRTARFLATGQRVTLEAAGARLAAWTWGEGPTVVLVHGWGGLGGQLRAFCPPLVRSGFRVVVFDAPGHGSSSGRRTSALDFAAALHSIARRFGAPHAVIAHSLGAAATALALRQGLGLDRAVFVGPPAEGSRWAREFGTRLGISETVLSGLRARAERRLGMKMSELDLPALAEGQTTPLLVIHDDQDAEVSWTEGAALARAWEGALFRRTSGLGHRRILQDPGVVDWAVEFVLGQKPSPTEGQVLDPAALDRYLFDRETRWV